MRIELYISEIERQFKRLAPETLRFLDRRKAAHSQSGWAILYRGFQHGRIKGPLQGKQVLGAAKEGSYATQRNLLMDRMQNSLFALDTKRGNLPQLSQDSYLCAKKHFLAKVMIGLGIRGPAIHNAKLALALAKKTGNTTVALDLLMVLKSHAALSGNLVQFLSLLDEISNVSTQLQAEIQSATMAERIHLLFARSGAEKPEKAEEAARAAEWILHAYNVTPSFLIKLDYFRVQTAALQLGGGL